MFGLCRWSAGGCGEEFHAACVGLNEVKYSDDGSNIEITREIDQGDLHCDTLDSVTARAFHFPLSGSLDKLPRCPSLKAAVITIPATKPWSVLARLLRFANFSSMMRNAVSTCLWPGTGRCVAGQMKADESQFIDFGHARESD